MELKCQQCGQALISGPGETMFCASCAMDDFLADDDNVPTLITSARISAKGRTVVQGHELIEELARGGMGIVYRARQLSPRRDVALKMLLPMESTVAEFRDRFKLEAKALADMDHPCILPLYNAGEHEGTPFFTMKLALGGSLAQLLKRGEKLDYRTIAGLIAKLAEAVFYANQRGILHRDIKPGNILFDENQHPFLADFGLAKLVGGDPANTMSMAAMGTPCYMAPEVAKRGANAATAAGDVYGLGAVLYELLAGKPPFQVEGLGAILKKVAEDAPEAPSTLAKGVPRDLEVIALTCLAKEPRKRYTTALALAEDLQRWLAGQPITARRVGPLERLWSWTKRHPAIAALATALVATMSIGSVSLYFQNRQLDHALQDSQHARHQSDAALKDAQLARDRSDQRVEFLLGDFADDLESIGRLSIVEKAWMDVDRAFQEDAAMSASPSGQLRQARLLTRWSRSMRERGQAQEALAKAQQARALQQKALAIQTATAADHDAQLEAGLAEARAQASLGHFSEAFACLDGLQALADLNSSRSYRFQAQIEYNRCDFLGEAGQKDPNLGAEALNAGQKSVTAARNWLAADPTDNARVELLATCLCEKATAVLHQAGLLDKRTPFLGEKIAPAETSLADFREAKAILDPLGQGLTADGKRLRMAAEFNSYYLLHRLPGDPAPHVEPMKRAVREAEELLGKDPANLHWAGNLCALYSESAHLHRLLDDQPAVMTFLEQATKLSDKITETAPLIRNWSLRAMRNHLALGNEYVASNRNDEACAAFRRAMAVTRQFLANNPTSAVDHEAFSNTMKDTAERIKQTGSKEAELLFYQENVQFMEAQLNTNASPFWSWHAGWLQRRIADMHEKQQDLPGALIANQEALKHRTTLLRQRWDWDPDKTARDAWNAYQMVAESQIQQNLLQEALGTASAALQLWKELGGLPGDRAPWSYAALKICDKIHELSKQQPHALEPAARLLAAQALDILYGQLPPQTPNDQAVFPRLKKLAGTPEN